MRASNNEQAQQAADALTWFVRDVPDTTPEVARRKVRDAATNLMAALGHLLRENDLDLATLAGIAVAQVAADVAYEERHASPSNVPSDPNPPR